MFSEITVVLPTYNEAGNLPDLVTALFALPLQGLSVLIVDDDSPDGTGKVADQLAIVYNGRMSVLHRSGKLGLASAYLTGFQIALDQGAQVIIQMDSDLSHPPEKLVELVKVLETCDLALGSRYISGGGVDRNWPFWRKGLSAFGNFYARTILNLPVRDATGGFRAWRRSALEQMPLKQVHSNGYAFLVELTYLASKVGLRIQEIPFVFADRRWGKSKMSFRIQREAAIRVWIMLFEHRKVKKVL